jgi:hypothetical protein
VWGDCTIAASLRGLLRIPTGDRRNAAKSLDRDMLRVTFVWGHEIPERQ